MYSEGELNHPILGEREQRESERKGGWGIKYAHRREREPSQREEKYLFVVGSEGARARATVGCNGTDAPEGLGLETDRFKVIMK